MLVNEVDVKPFRDMVRPAIEMDFIAKNGDTWLKKINALLKGKALEKSGPTARD